MIEKLLEERTLSSLVGNYCGSVSKIHAICIYVVSHDEIGRRDDITLANNQYLAERQHPRDY